MSDALTDLNGTLCDVWARLESGVVVPGSPANLPVLATASPSGGAARIVVLRGVDRSAQTLWFYSHAAASKVADLKANSRAELLIWDPRDRLQIRLGVSIDLGTVSADVWDGLGPGTRLNYATDPLPGTKIDDPSDAQQATPQHHQMVLLTAHIARIETLQITNDGLRRAVFEGGTSRWIAP